MAEESTTYEDDPRLDEEEVLLKSRLGEAARRSPKYMRMVAAMARDPEVPTRAKAALLLGGTYVISPVDLIPGIIPVLGQLDDLIVFAVALKAALAICPQHVVERHLNAADLSTEDIERDEETATLAAHWMAAKGLGAVRYLTNSGMRITSQLADRARRGYVDWRTGR